MRGNGDFHNSIRCAFLQPYVTSSLPNHYETSALQRFDNPENDYLLDREIQRMTSYAGIWGVNDQDRSIQESMGPIYDRRKEHLGTSDLAIITARRRLLN